MPFTPFHLGAGAVFKAIGGTRFSFMVFGGTQVLMDIEPLVGMLRGADILHGYTHTIAGAALIGGLAGAIGKSISTQALNGLGIAHLPITWRVAFVSAWLGSFSHLLLDGIMHADMRPLWPFAQDNPLLDRIGIEELHLLCLVLGVLGATGYALRRRHL